MGSTSTNEGGLLTKASSNEIDISRYWDNVKVSNSKIHKWDCDCLAIVDCAVTLGEGRSQSYKFARHEAQLSFSCLSGKSRPTGLELDGAVLSRAVEENRPFRDWVESKGFTLFPRVDLGKEGTVAVGDDMPTTMVSNADNVEEEGATCGRTYQVTLNDSQCRPALFGLVDRFSKESNFRYCHPINGGYEISLYAIEQELSTAHVVEQTSPQATSLGQIQSEGDVRACRSSLETHILFATDQSMVFNGIGISGYEDTSLKNRACVDWMKTKQFAMKTDSDLSRSGEFAEGDRFAEEALQGLTVTLHNGQETVQKLEDVFFTVRGETVIYGGEADDAKSVQSEMAMLFMPVDIK